MTLIGCHENIQTSRGKRSKRQRCSADLTHDEKHKKAKLYNDMFSRILPVRLGSGCHGVCHVGIKGIVRESGIQLTDARGGDRCRCSL